MRGKDHLYYLIHSLSKSEKRYFTIDAKRSGHKQSRYLDLFHFINKQPAYDEKALKKKFGKKLADDKSRLYEALLNSLRDYQSSKSYKTRIKELLTDAKILFERKLYEQCENRLAEAKALALELQDHLAVLEINLRQRQLIKEYQHKDYAEQVEQLITEKEHHLRIVQEEFWLHDNYDRLSVDYVRYHNKVDEETAARLEQKYEAVLAYNDTGANFYVSWRYHQTLALYHRLTGDNELEFIEFEISAALWEEHPTILAENYFLYLGDAFNILSLTSRDPKRFDQLPSLIEQLDKEQEKRLSQQARGLLFERITIYKLLYLINSKKPVVNLESELLKIEQGLNSYMVTPSTEFSILINCTLLLFLNDHFEACLSWLQRIWQLQKKTQLLRQDIQNNSRILQLLSAYKVGEIEEVENLIRSGKRYFNKIPDSRAQKELYFSIAKSINRSFAVFNKKEEKHIFTALKEEIHTLDNRLPGGIDEITLLWVDSILKTRKIQDLR